MSSGIGGIAIVYMLAPLLDNQIQRLHPAVLIPLCLLLITGFAVDNVYSAEHPNSGRGITDYEGENRMLAVYLSPLYILVNVYIVRRLLGWMGACCGVSPRRFLRPCGRACLCVRCPDAPHRLSSAGGAGEAFFHIRRLLLDGRAPLRDPVSGSPGARPPHPVSGRKKGSPPAGG